jgi:hypothetical protein
MEMFFLYLKKKQNDKAILRNQKDLREQAKN